MVDAYARKILPDGPLFWGSSSPPLYLLSEPIQQRLARLHECLEAAHIALDHVDGLRASRQL